MHSVLEVRAGCPGPVPPSGSLSPTAPHWPWLRLRGCGSQAGGKAQPEALASPVLSQLSRLFVEQSCWGMLMVLCALGPHAGFGAGAGMLGCIPSL